MMEPRQLCSNLPHKFPRRPRIGKARMYLRLQIEPNPALRLVKESPARSGRDNKTAVVIEVM
jgi:hypothetical protein